MRERRLSSSGPAPVASAARPELVAALPPDLPVMQNLGRFYIYDMARYCGALPGWQCPDDGLWACADLAGYFGAPRCHPFLLRAGRAPAGFVVVKWAREEARWNLEQFFVAAPYQGQGNGRRLFRELLQRFPGAWRLEVMPENSRALAFWRRVTRERDPAAREALETPPHGQPRIVMRLQG